MDGSEALQIIPRRCIYFYFSFTRRWKFPVRLTAV